MPLDPAQKCCLLCVCCECNERREKKQAAMAALQIDGVLSYSGEGHSQASKVLDWVFDNFDLVPKELGQAIVKAYRPIFEMAHKVRPDTRTMSSKNYDTNDDEAMFNPARPVNPER